jgi:soluble lytic murein transglycosylase-like protein
MLFHGRPRRTAVRVGFVLGLLASGSATSAEVKGLTAAIQAPARPATLAPLPEASQSEAPIRSPVVEKARSDGREAYRRISRTEAERQEVPFELVDAVMRVESAFNPLASGAAGEVGLMQIMPPTARLLGHRGSNQDLAVPETNIRLGTTYLAQAWKLAKQDICTTVMKYRAGHNETRFSVLSVRYCERVRTHLASLGYPLTGRVPEPTFGFKADVTRMGIGIGTQAAARRLATGRKLKSRVGWSAHDARMKALIARGRLSL